MLDKPKVSCYIADTIIRQGKGYDEIPRQQTPAAHRFSAIYSS